MNDETRPPRDPVDDCWKRVGIAGNRQCPELQAVGHCRNCSRYSAAVARMLDREPPQGYVAHWTALLAQPEQSDSLDTTAVIVFRLGKEWLALPAEVFEEVTEIRPVRRIPHRSNDVLLGLTNVRGTIQMCVSLARLLAIDEEPAPEEAPGPGRRLLVITRDGQRWAFPVDEVHGIRRVAPSRFEGVPGGKGDRPASCEAPFGPPRQMGTVSSSRSTLGALAPAGDRPLLPACKGLFRWGERHVGCLDDARVFEALRRSVQ